MGESYFKYNKWISIKTLFFIIPFIFSALNLQSFSALFISTAVGQFLAYFVLGIILVGVLIFLKHSDRSAFTSILKLWTFYYFLYYVIATYASGSLGTGYALLKTLVHLIYFFGFAIYLGAKEYRKNMLIVITFTFFIACLFSVYFDFINFSLDYKGVAEYRVERSSGIYGDANNAALVSILSFVFMYYVVRTKNRLQFFLKVGALFIIMYSLIITYSTTGFLSFLIVSLIIFKKYFSFKRIIVLLPFIIALGYFGYNYINSSNVLSYGQLEKVNNIINLITFSTDEVNFSGRDERLNNLFDVIEKQVFLGNGLDYGATVVHSHNTYFNVWADSGIFPFTIFLIINITYYLKLFRYNPPNKLLALTALIPLSIFMMTLQTIINQAYLMVIFVFIAYLIEDYGNTGKDSETLT